MKKRRSALISTAVVLVLLVLFLLYVVFRRAGQPRAETEAERVTIRFGITPYQDTALPVVGDRLGWYEEKNLDVQFVPLSWGDVVLALSSGSIDASIYTINAFQAPYSEAVAGRFKPIFYSPIYVFKGTAIMVHGDSGLSVVGNISSLPAPVREGRVVDAVRQLRGKRIAVTQGTEYEQIVLAALAKAGLDPGQDVTLIHASVEDALAAFLSGDVDAFGAGLTERIEAQRHGAKELLVAADVGPPSIDGLVTTQEFASRNRDAMDDLLRVWFRTVDYMEGDLKGRSRFVREYLRGKASTRYSPDEYAIAWTFNVFPRTPSEAVRVFNSPEGAFYWKNVWDYNNQFLMSEGKIKEPVPYSAYWGTEVLSRVAETVR